jgi:serine/threonine protein kinase
MKYELIDKRYSQLLQNIRQLFESSVTTLHKARNEVKEIVYDNESFVVKSFKKPNIINRFAYTFIRDSKAKKSFLYAKKIEEFTPKPIAYIEYFNNMLLDKSFYISEKFEYDFTIKAPLDYKNFNDRETIFREFAKFTHKLHQNRIFHLDYSPGNILIKRENDNYIFKIVDINRMKFKNLSVHERLKNFERLDFTDGLDFIIDEYAKLIGISSKSALKDVKSFSRKHKRSRDFKKRLKGKKVA